MLKRLLVVIISASFILTQGCSGGGKIKIALMTKLESGSLVGMSEVNAARMFLEKSGIRNIEIVPFDDGWEPAKTERAYRQMRDEGIDILITSHISTCAVAIKGRINSDRVFTMVTGATTDALSNSDDYIFRNIQDVEGEQKSIAEYMNSRGFRRLLVVRDTDNSAYGEPALKYFKKYLSVKPVDVIDIRISDFDPELLKKQMGRTGFDSLYLLIGGYKTAAGSIAQLGRRINRGVPVVYTPWMKSPDLLQTAGDSIEGSIIPSHYPPRGGNPAVDSYLKSFKERYNYNPTFISLNVYTAIEIISMALSEGNRTPDSIKSYLLKKGTINTEFGTVKFNSSGDVESPLYFITDIRSEFRQ